MSANANGGAVFHPNVISLESIRLEDNVPRVQPTPASIEYEVAPQANLLQYVDHGGYKTELGAEVEAIGELEKVLEVGRMHVNVLYSFRSVSRAIPMVSGSDDPTKAALQMNTFKVLRPEMEKLKDMMLFYESAIQVFCTNVETLAKRGKKQVVPEGLYDALIAVVDLLQKMDYLKDTKACLTNDFSRYKRSLTSVRQELPDAESLGQEQHSLQMFLGNPKYPKQLIINTLRDGTKAIPGHLEVLMKMLQLAVERLETNRYMTPDEKYRNIRVVPHILWLLDGDTSSGSPEGSFNVFKQRKFKLQPLQRICQRYPVVPQCGDVAIKLSYVLERCPHFDPDSSGAWFADTAAAQDYNVLAKWGRMTGDFDEYATRLSNAMNEIGSGPFVKTAVNVRMAAKVSRLVILGLRLLQRWSCVVLECVAWKYTHPCSQATFEAAGGDAKGKGMEYEKVVRYNWSERELSALVEVITMTKSLGSLLSRAESRLAPLLRLHVHASTQQMAQGDLVPVLHRADKKKRDIVKHLLQLRSMVSDWSEGRPPADDYKKYKRAQGRVEAKAAPRRVVGPSSTQLQLVRAMVRAIYDENSELRQSTGLLGREDLNKDDFGLLRSYYEESFGFPYLLDLAGTIRCTTDLGELWYREYHLELTKEIQFPIEMSFPWIITEHIVKTKRAMSLESSNANGGSKPAGSAAAGAGADGHNRTNSNASDAGAPARGADADGSLTSYGGGRKSKKKGWKGGSGGGMGHVLVEEMLWALDLYNDAAHRALYVLNSQYLFNEIQAEVNLVFNQLLFHLEAEVYGYFKDWAASTTLDKMFKRVVETRRGWGHYFPGRRRYETPIQQRHVQLLGRSVDLTRRISVAMNLKISEDLELALRKFESGDLAGIVELEGSIEAAKQTHGLIKQAGLGIDPFSSLWGEANEVMSPASNTGRVVAHVVRTLVLDLFANYRFCASTRRLVKSPVEIKPMKYPVPPAAMDKNLGAGRLCGRAFEQLYSVGRHFVGGMHLESMVRVLGYADLPVVIETIIEHMQQKLLDIKDWTDALKGGLPPVKLPKYDFGTAGCYSFMEEKLRPILEYEDLKAGVFQDFREFGNALAFLQCLSEVTAGRDCLKFVHTVPVMGLSSSKKWDPTRTRLVAATAALSKGTEVSGPAGASLSGLDQLVLEGQDLCKGLATSASLFRHTLSELDAALDRLNLRESWAGAPPSNRVMDVEESSAFSRLFSALNFLFCMPEAAGEARVTDAVQFGDGFGLAGAVITHMLGQRQQFELLDFAYHVLNVNNFEKAGSRDGEAGRNVEPAKARETDAFISEAHRAYCLIFDAFSVAEAVLPSRASGASSEVRIFHPPQDDTKINRALLSDSGMWETQDIYGDQKAAEAAKRVQRKLSDKKITPNKGGSGLSSLWRKEKISYVPSEADRIDEENRKKKLNDFTNNLVAFIGGGEESKKPGPELPAPISTDLLAGAGMTSPTRVSPVRIRPSVSPTGPAGAASRAKPPAAAPPLPGAADVNSGSKSVPGRPPPPSGPPQAPGMQGLRPPNPGKMGLIPAKSTGSVGSAGSMSSLSKQLPRARSMSPPPSGSLAGLDGLAIGAPLSNREGRSTSIDGSGQGEKGPLPPGVDKIMEMGFSERKARAALERTDGDAGLAVEWLLSQPSSPDRGEPTKEDMRPPSPSTVSPPPRKSLKKKLKPGAPQNAIFDGEAFTPVLIPARQAPRGTAAPIQQTWTNPPSSGGGSGAGPARSPNPALVSPDALALVPSGVGFGLGPGPGPGPGPGQNQGLVRPRSTPDVISALDPDAVEQFERGAAPGQQPQGQQQFGGGQRSPVPSNLGGEPGGQGTGMQYRRQSAPSGLSPSKVTSGMSAVSPLGQPNSGNVGGQPNVQPQQQQQQRPPSNNSSMGGQLLNKMPQLQLPMAGASSPSPQQQQQPRPSMNPNVARRPPPPSGPAAVGGSTSMNIARTPVPRGAAAIGGMPRAASGSSTQAVVPIGAQGSPQVRPYPQLNQGMMVPQNQQQNQQARPMQQMGSMAMQGSQGAQPQSQPRGPSPGGMGPSGSMHQLRPMSGNMHQGGMGNFAQPPQQQQFQGQNQGQNMVGGGQPRGIPVMNSGQQMARPMGMSNQGSPPFSSQQGRPQLLQPTQQQQPRPQQFSQQPPQSQARPMQLMQGRPQQQSQQFPNQQHARPQQQQQQVIPNLQPSGRPQQQMQQQIRPQMQQLSSQQLPRGQQQQPRPMQQQPNQTMSLGQQQPRPMQQQQLPNQGMQLQVSPRGPQGMMGQQGMQPQASMRQGMMPQQGMPQQQQHSMRQSNQARSMMAVQGGAARPQLQQQQMQQPRPFVAGSVGFGQNQMQQPQVQQRQQGPGVNMGGGQFGQAGGLTPQQQQQQQQQQQRIWQQQQQQQQRQQRQFNPTG